MHTRNDNVVAWRGPPPQPLIHAPAPWRDRIDLAAQQAIAAWTEPECSGLQFRSVTAPHFSISLVWTFPGRPGDLAWTEVQSTPYGGIRSAHIHLNAWLITRKQMPPDLNTVVMHELGHALGIDHSHDRSSAMWHGIVRGRTHAYLADDDHAAVCGTYPTDVFDASEREAGMGWWWLLLALLPPVPFAGQRLWRSGLWRHGQGGSGQGGSGQGGTGLGRRKLWTFPWRR